jgi:Flp pilus assembly protein TadD
VIEEDMRTLTEITNQRMQKTPNDPSLHCQVAQILVRGGQVEEAVRWVQAALRIDPKYGKAHQMLATYYLRTGNQALAGYHRTQARLAIMGETPSSPPTPSPQREKREKTAPSP